MANQFDYDLFVIGTGEAGATAAHICREKGLRVAIADDNPFGGTCSLRGCNPKRTLSGAAELFFRAEFMQGNGVEGELSLNWEKLIEFKQKMTRGISEKHEHRFAEHGIDMYHGVVTLADTNQIEIGGKRLSFEKILIASGSTPRSLNVPGEEYVTTSEQLFELKALPSHVTFIGGGYVSMELSQIVAAAGAKVTVLEYAPLPLIKFDHDLVTMLAEEVREYGVDIQISTKLVKIEKTGDDFLVFVENDGTQTFKTGLVVHGAGRIPNISGLRLENANVSFNSFKIRANEYLQSVSNGSVYVAGDAYAQSPQLTPVAEQEGKVVAHNIVHGNSKIPDYRVIPSTVFTFPGLSSVGETLYPGQNRPDLETIFRDTSQRHITRRLGLKRSAFKVIVDKKSRKIRGAHMLGHNVDEVINFFALAMRMGAKIGDLKEIPLTFPGVTYDTVMRL